MSVKRTLIEEGRWYKGNTHTHTTMSDGGESPAFLASLYKQAGYAFTTLTDHRVYGVHSELESDGFLIMPGVELDCATAPGGGFCHHIVGIGTPERSGFTHGQRFDYPGETTAAELIRLLRDNGHLCIYAHPRWSHIVMEEFDRLQGCIGVEVYNHTCETGFGSGDSETYFDRILWSGGHAWAVASDDCHEPGRDSIGGFVCVKAPELSHQAIWEALRTGSFYASNGPAVEDFYVEDGTAHVVCSPCWRIDFLSDSMPGKAMRAGQEALTAAAYPLDDRQTYIRAVCTDENGRKAWTQPIWL